jgi:hypothetical protein
MQSHTGEKQFQDASADYLIIASSSDLTASYFWRYLQGRQVSCSLIQLEHYAWDAKALEHIVSGAAGIYYRAPGPTSLASINFLTAVRSVVAAHSNVIAPSDASTNWSKPLQMAMLLQKYRSDYVRGVDTYVSNVKIPRSEDYVVKSMSNSRSTVVTSSCPELQLTSPLAHPVQFQTRLIGMNVRVHQVGSQTFACTVLADALDYRYSSSAIYESIQPPDGLMSWCRYVTESEGLRFAGIDLIKTGNTFACLEINPMPGYEGFETHAFDGSCPISDALYGELQAPRVAHSHTRSAGL